MAKRAAAPDTNGSAGGKMAAVWAGKASPATVEQEAARAEQARTECIQGRRSICGKILKVLPEGLVIESGYTSLMRSPLNRSWLVPGTVPASRDASLVEGREPDAACVGLVFLTDLPKSRQNQPKAYDYVILRAYPAGQYTYTPAGNIRRTVRRFSGGLETAVRLSMEARFK